jgi:hypothetical protein
MKKIVQGLLDSEQLQYKGDQIHHGKSEQSQTNFYFRN